MFGLKPSPQRIALEAAIEIMTRAEWRALRLYGEAKDAANRGDASAFGLITEQAIEAHEDYDVAEHKVQELLDQLPRRERRMFQRQVLAAVPLLYGEERARALLK